MKGSGQLASNPTCSGPGFLQSDYLPCHAKSLELIIRGTQTDPAFKLHLMETRIDEVLAGLISYALVLSVPITCARSAEGETDVNVAVPDSPGVTVSAGHKVTMTCIACQQKERLRLSDSEGSLSRPGSRTSRLVDRGMTNE